MFGKLYKNSSVKGILVVSLSNIGDVVLTCTVIDILLRDFPSADVSVIVGPKAQTLFAGHPRIKTIIYDKQRSWWGQVRWFLSLRKNTFDVIVDMRQSGLALFLPCRWHTPLMPKPSDGHRGLKHFDRLKSIYPQIALPCERLAILPKPVEAMWRSPGYVVIAPGAADSAKRWHPAGFIALADVLGAQGHRIVFVGDGSDAATVETIRKGMKNPSISLAGKTDLRELAFVLQQAKFAITHDSGTMHLACYFDVPVVALWGPTDVNKYGPWSSKSAVVRGQGSVSSITAEDVLGGIAQVQ